MQKLIIATIGLSLSMGVAGAAVAQMAGTPGQMQTAPGASGDPSTSAPASPGTSTAPSTGTMPSDPSAAGGTAPATGAMAPDSTSSGNMATPSAPPAPPANQSYPRCSKTVHDECRQRS